MSDCIKPQTKVFIFGSLEGMAGGWVHMPLLDLYILSRWRPSYKMLTSLPAQISDV